MNWDLTQELSIKGELGTFEVVSKKFPDFFSKNFEVIFKNFQDFFSKNFEGVFRKFPDYFQKNLSTF